MNIVDYIIIGLIALSALWGFYRGFIQSVLSMGACLISLFASFHFYPKLAALIQGSEGLVVNLIHYTDASSRIGDLELALSNVASLTGSTIESILTNVNLPAPLDAILAYNLQNDVFASLRLNSVSDYVNQTIVSVALNILCFLACFVVIFIVLSIVINLLRAVFRFPLLKQLDWLFGGAFGLVRGIILCYAAFLLVPLVATVIPLEAFNTLLNESMLAAYFNNGTLLLSVMNGHL